MSRYDFCPHCTKPLPYGNRRPNIFKKIGKGIVWFIKDFFVTGFEFYAEFFECLFPNVGKKHREVFVLVIQAVVVLVLIYKW